MIIKLDNRVYDVLKWIVMIVLPALGVLYSAIAGLWGWPYAKEIVGTLAAVEAFLGALIGVSTAAYRREDAAHDSEQ